MELRKENSKSEEINVAKKLYYIKLPEKLKNKF